MKTNCGRDVPQREGEGMQRKHPLGSSKMSICLYRKNTLNLKYIFGSGKDRFIVR